ncbi:Neuroligin-4: X-linked-like protein, partial [Dinothrombium tinctorium]
SEANGYSARLGCVHGDELPYVFGAPFAHFYLQKTLGFFPPNYTKPEVTLSETVMFQWTNFVKYGHRLSFWLNLIPKLEKHGKEESDHLKRHLQDQGTLDTEVSVFERISLKFLSSLQTPGQKSSISLQEKSSPTTPTNRPPNILTDLASNAVNATTNSSESQSPTVQQTNYYSTALSITIAIGVILLILNIAIFAGVYYHLNKHKKRKKYPSVGYVDVSQNAPQTVVGQNAQSFGHICCENHHHLCTFNTNEANYSNHCAGAESVTVHCAVSEKLCQCNNCCTTQNVCDTNNCLGVIHEFDEHL